MFTALTRIRLTRIIEFVPRLFLFLMVTSSCYSADIPDYYSEPGINPHRSYINQDFGEIIDPFTGKLQLHYTDVYIPGEGGFDLKIQRSYTSLDENLPLSPKLSIIGMGWDMTFGIMTKSKMYEGCVDRDNTTTNNPVMTLPDGSKEVFARPSQASSVFGGSTPDYISKNRWIADCQDTPLRYGVDSLLAGWTNIRTFKDYSIDIPQRFSRKKNNRPQWQRTEL